MATSSDKRTGRIAARALTDAAIRTLSDGESRTDGALPVGNGRLVITCRKARGVLRKTWTFRYRTATLSGELKLGDYPALGLDAARQKARTHIENVSGGVDPKLAQFDAKQETAKAQREKAKLGTFEGLLDAYVDWLRSKDKESTKDVAGLFARHVTGPFPDLAKYPARTITQEHIRDILARMVKAGIGRQTNVLRSCLMAAFTHGAHADLDPRRAADDGAVFRLVSNPVTLLPKIAEYESTSDRLLTDDEIRFLMSAIAGDAPIPITIRCAVLLSSQRIRQLLRATWLDYDKDSRVLRLLDRKGKRAQAIEHLLPVSDAVAELIDHLEALNSGGKYIFSTTGGDKPIHHTTFSAAVSEIGKACNLASATPAEHPFTAGDIRRTAETRLQALKVSRDVRSQLMSHGRKGGVQAKHYERHDYLPEKVAAFAVWEAHLTAVVENKTTGGEVIKAKFGTKGKRA